MDRRKIDKTVQDVCRRFVDRRLRGACLLASVVLRDQLLSLGIGSELILGYLVRDPERRYAFRHVWLRDESGRTLDIGGNVTKQVVWNVRREAWADAECLETLPDGCVLVDTQTVDGMCNLFLLEQAFFGCKTKEGTRKYVNGLPASLDWVKKYWGSLKKRTPDK